MSNPLIDTNASVVILAEAVNGKPIPATFEIATLGKRLLSGDSSRLIAAAPPGLSEEGCKELAEAGVGTILLMEDPRWSTHYCADLWVAGLEGIITDVRPGIVLAPHTTIGAEVMPRLAARIGGAVATACERLENTAQGICATRACYGSNAREELELSADVSFVTIKPKAIEFDGFDRGRTGEVRSVVVNAAGTPHIPTVINRESSGGSDGVALERARAIVAGGRGLGGAGGFEPLQELANLLGGAVGASRVACDLGWCPQSWQVGLTGKTVTPELYIAVGISGASHHMAGCGQSKTIVAINSDETAPIFTQAHIGIVGDCNEMIPAIINALRENRNAA